MRCPFCNNPAHKVIDKRNVVGKHEIRRRRECLKCEKRFTTYEKAADLHLIVIKKDGRREPFYKEKLRAGIVKALEKRPLENKADEIIALLERKLLKSGRRKITSKMIGKMVLTELKKIDMVAYLRFASVYRRFENPEDFTKEVSSLSQSND